MSRWMAPRTALVATLSLIASIFATMAVEKRMLDLMPWWGDALLAVGFGSAARLVHRGGRRQRQRAGTWYDYEETMDRIARSSALWARTRRDGPLWTELRARIRPDHPRAERLKAIRPIRVRHQDEDRDRDAAGVHRAAPGSLQSRRRHLSRRCLGPMAGKSEEGPVMKADRYPPCANRVSGARLPAMMADLQQLDNHHHSLHTVVLKARKANDCALFSRRSSVLRWLPCSLNSWRIRSPAPGIAS